MSDIDEILLLSLFILVLLGLSDARLRERECEVCISVMEKIAEKVKQEKITAQEKIEKAIKDICKGLKDKKDNRLCYYIGGTNDAATSLLREISKPISYGLPSDKICERLKKKDLAICELTYERKINVEEVDFSKLRVKELKGILSDWKEKCVGCTSKEDYLRLIEQVKSKHVGQGTKSDL